MKDESVLRFGGRAAITVGCLYMLVGATHFLMPRAQLRGAGGVTAAFFPSLAANPVFFVLHYWLVVALSLLTFALIAACFSLLREHLSGPVCWALALGTLGAALAAIDFAEFAVEAPRLARLYVAAAPEARSLLVMSGVPHVDPCFFSFGLLGVFALTVNGACLRHKLLPRLLAGVGIAGGALFVLVFLGSLLRNPPLVDLAVGLGGLVVGPLWYVWVGIVLTGRGRAMETAGC